MYFHLFLQKLIQDSEMTTIDIDIDMGIVVEKIKKLMNEEKCTCIFFFKN